MDKQMKEELLGVLKDMQMRNKYLKTWHGMKRRQRLASAEDLIDRLQTSRKKKHT